MSIPGIKDIETEESLVILTVKENVWSPSQFSSWEHLGLQVQKIRASIASHLPSEIYPGSFIVL